MRRALVPSAVAVAAIALGACGGGKGNDRPGDGAHATAVAAAATDRPRPPADRSPELVWIKRVAAVPDPIADDLRIQRSGRATFRKGYGGLGRGIAVQRLAADDVRRFERLVARARPASLPAPQADPTRGGFAYTIRAQGGTGAVNSGHFPIRAAPLLRAADRLISRLADHLEFHSLNR